MRRGEGAGSRYVGGEGGFVVGNQWADVILRRGACGRCDRENRGPALSSWTDCADRAHAGGVARRLVGSTATALSLQTAISAKVAPPGVIMPWSTVCKAINDALNSRFLEVEPGGPVSWPCEDRARRQWSFACHDSGHQHGRRSRPASSVGIRHRPGLVGWRRDIALADAMADVQATVAAYGTSLIFKVSVEAQGLPPEARKALRNELAKAVEEFT